jgi:peptidyl-prolyl cis-trans isomerase SurA
MRSTYLKIITPLSLLFLFVLTGNAASMPINGIAIVVNNKIITDVDLNQATQAILEIPKADGTKLTAAEACKQASDKLIDQEIVLQMAQANKVTVSQEDLNKAMDQIAAEHQLTRAALPKALAEQHISFDQFTQQITKQLTIQKFEQEQLGGNIKITPKEIDELAKKLAHQAPQAKSEMLYHFTEIVIPLPAKPTSSELAQTKGYFDAIAKLINENKDFDTISQTVLHQPARDLGWNSLSQLPAGFTSIAAKMKVGGIAPPVRSPEGVLIIKLIETKKSDATEPAKINNKTNESTRQAQAKDMLFEQKMNTAVQQLVSRLKSQAYIKKIPGNTSCYEKA